MTVEDTAAALGLELGATQKEQLTSYLALLQRWNTVYNLTAVRDPAHMLTHHLADCMAVVPPLKRHLGGKPARLLDVGSGGGLPGVVLAILCPQVEVTCVDTVGKKAAFIRQVAAELQLHHLQALHSRVENVKGTFDVITSRAFASLGDFCRLTAHAMSKNSVWVAMKGHRPDDEIRDLVSTVRMFHVEQLHVPGLDAERCLVWLRPAD